MGVSFIINFSFLHNRKHESNETNIQKKSTSTAKQNNVILGACVAGIGIPFLGKIGINIADDVYSELANCINSTESMPLIYYLYFLGFIFIMLPVLASCFAPIVRDISTWVKEYENNKNKK